jgi:hypothetical protein
MLITVGRTVHIFSFVASLNCLQNSAICIPVGPRAVPTGGAGVACPALSCNLTTFEGFFFGAIISFKLRIILNVISFKGEFKSFLF